MSEEKKIYTLHQLTTSLENFILRSFGSKNFWVVAEITKINTKGNNRYLELADSEKGKTTALMSATIWSTTYNNIRQKIGENLPAILQSGNKVLFSIRIDYHQLYGLKLNILDIDPSYSYGEIERQKKETILRLQKEELFDLQQQLTLSPIPKRVALIGSPGTSGYRDFLDELQQNRIYRNFEIKVFAASVQGDRAAAELIKALEEARTYSVDVIIMVRGGGSKMDLHVFNDYELAKCISETKIPVVTGIGHETDEVVADLVCWQKCITPTSAAKFLYLRIGTFAADLQSAYDVIKQFSLSLLGSHKDEFNHLKQYLQHFSRQFLLEKQLELKEKSHRLQIHFKEFIQIEQSELKLQLDQIARQAVNQLRLNKESDLPARIDRVQLASKNLIQKSEQELKGLAELLDVLNPERLLKSGYTISTIDDQDIKELKGELIGKEMRTLTSHSIIQSTITKTEKTQHED